MAQQLPLSQPPAKGFNADSPLVAASSLSALPGASPFASAATPLPSSAPRRPSVPGHNSSFSGSGTPAQANAAVPNPSNSHQQALLLRSQQNARTFFSGSPGGGSLPLPSALPADGGPPHKVPVHRAFSRIRETDPGEDFPSIPEGDQPRVQQWIERDIEYEEELVEAKRAQHDLAKEMLEEMAREQDWLGPLDPQPRGKFRLRFPQEKVVEEQRGKKGPLRVPVALSKSQLRAAASAPEHLIPIRLDLEHDVYKLRDTFTWNLKETNITPELFAQHLLADLRLPQHPFLKEMIASIKKQIAEAQPSACYNAFVDPAVDESKEESRQWFEERARKRRRLGKEKAQGEFGVTDEELMGEGDEPMPLAELGLPLGSNDELRVLIKLDITLDTIQLVDRFEWDITNPSNSPEEFAETFATELGLTGEFATAIAHAIREQVDIYTRSLFLLNYSKGGFIGDEELRREFLPILSPAETFRTDNADAFTPLLNQLTRDEVDRQEKEHDRENRRKRRQTKGRGIVLPDREPVRTVRTLVPRSLPGLVSSEIDQKGHKIYHLPELNEPYPVVGKPVPPKPADLDTNDASPLKLLLSKDKAHGSNALLAAAAANRAKGGVPGLESPVKGGAIRKKPPVIRPNPEELGLHEHIVDGQWFCANCGVPDRLAVGRRKGPTGKDSLCGTCGKFFHRYKRQRPCVYTRDYDTHFQQKAAEDAKKPSRSKKAAPAIGAVVAEDAADRSARTSGRGTPVSQAMSPESDGHDQEGDDSDDSSASSPRKKRGNYYGSPDTPFVNLDSDDSEEEESVAGGSPPPPPSTRQHPSPPPQPQPPAPLAAASGAAPAQPSASSTAPQPLPWMVAAAAELRSKQVDDRFEIIPRRGPADSTVQEWRIRCLDCPGKLYNLGPGETLDGFLVHFKNRNHRLNVEARLAKEHGQ
ncbi:hypothetical protein JCM6882_003204 [Rhodosporidiobolus microsporus]